MLPIASQTSMLETVDEVEDHLVRLTAEQTLNLAPFLRADRVAGAVYEQGVKDMDAACTR